MPPEEKDSIYLLINCLIALIAAVVILRPFFNGFFGKLKYLNLEIKRTSGSERRRWKKKRRRLFLSLIPFVKDNM
ncbi:MAG: hypothetical protein IKA51_01985 [Clostridia bacterium]|nr:hypothetical protein [Clostridia bacterium]